MPNLCAQNFLSALFFLHLIRAVILSPLKLQYFWTNSQNRFFAKYYQLRSVFSLPSTIEHHLRQCSKYSKLNPVSFKTSFGRGTSWLDMFLEEKLPKLPLKTSFLQFCAQAMCPNYFLCLQMNSTNHCGHFEVCIVGIAQQTRKS